MNTENKWKLLLNAMANTMAMMKDTYDANKGNITELHFQDIMGFVKRTLSVFDSDDDTYAKYLDVIQEKLKIFNSEKFKDTNFTLTPKQKEILKSLIEEPHVIINKHRQAGITTLVTAYLAVYLTDSTTPPQTVHILGCNYGMAKINANMLIDFIEQLDEKAEIERVDIYTRIYGKHKIVTLTTADKAYLKCSRFVGERKPTILFIDEMAFIEGDLELLDFPKKTIIASTPKTKDNAFEKIFKNGDNDFFKVSYPWYENPLFNKFLTWTYDGHEVPEPIIDDNGSVKYDPSRWRYIIDSGFKPTSREYEKFRKYLGEENLRREMDIEI